jgi:DNA-binding response OmpR family regulator
MRALVVGDDVEEVAEVVRAEGYHVFEANGDDARAVAPTADLVVIDLAPPVDERLLLLRALRAAGLGMPILVIADRHDEQAITSALGAGASDFIARPVDEHELAARLHAAARRRQEQERRAGRERELSELAERLRDRSAIPPARPPIAEVDPLILDRVPYFLENRRRDAAAIIDAVRRAEFTAVARFGHDLRGLGASYGFGPITELGGRLEEAASARDSAAAYQLALELVRYLNGVHAIPRTA